MFIQPKWPVPSTWSGHIPFAGWIMAVLQPRKFVELGTFGGTSYVAFCRTVADYQLPTRCWAVDTWQGDAHTGAYPDAVYRQVSTYNQAEFSSFSTLLRMTFDKALDQFEDGSIDLLHIDGFHTYEAVRHDFETWRGKLSSRGVVLFHDVAVRTGDFGVWKFWDEIRAGHPHVSFQHSSGLGVLFLGPDQPKEVAAMIAHADIAIPAFEALGRGHMGPERLGVVARRALSWRVEAMARKLGLGSLGLGNRDSANRDSGNRDGASTSS